jgi:hypothetical protein
LLLAEHGRVHSSRKVQLIRMVTKLEGVQMVVVTQTLVDQFVRNDKHYFRFSGEVVNKSNRPLKVAELVAHKLYGTLWGLDKVHENGNVYVLPLGSGTTLQPGQSINFSYVHSYEKAQLFVQSYELA